MKSITLVKHMTKFCKIESVTIKYMLFSTFLIKQVKFYLLFNILIFFSLFTLDINGVKRRLGDRTSVAIH